jgi:MoxR-like ATPase
VSTLSDVLHLSFNRVQFTPDLMPSDITGTDLLEEDPETRQRRYRFLRGPIFANIVLADEINRTPPKTQAALLQAMQEYRVTASGQTYGLDLPFFVLATQNPIEQEGTYPLPEAQVDRFMFKVVVGYPSKDEEIEVMRRMATGEEATIAPVVHPDDIRRARAAVEMIYMDPQVERYIVDLVFATRDPASCGLKDLSALIAFGASPRATINLARAARAHAFLRRRGYVTPDDVRSIGLDVLRHRVLLTYEAEAEEVSSDDVVNRVLGKVEVP